MAAPKGTRPPNAGIGKKPGTLNKTTALVKDMVAQALDKAGGVDYLVRQATANPAAFLTLVGKLLPMQVTGEDGGAVKIQLIERTIVRPKA